MTGVPAPGLEACQIVGLLEAHTTSGFTCGRSPEIEAFFREKSWEFERQGFSRTHVLISGSPSSLPPVVGYYSLCNARIGVSELAPNSAGGPTQLPVVLLGQLGRDDRAPAGIGKYLMADMFRKVLKIAEISGCCGVTLDAKNSRLVTYYEQFGCASRRRRQRPQKMFLEIGTLRAAAGMP